MRLGKEWERGWEPSVRARVHGVHRVGAGNVHFVLEIVLVAVGEGKIETLFCLCVM